MNTYRGVLFDLDGTLADTAPDLAAALNFVRQQENLTPLPLTTIRQVASDGAQGLLSLGFGIDKNHQDFERLREVLLGYYADHVADQTKIFIGMEKILQQLHTRNIPWGIVTNKPIQFTHELLEKLALPSRPACVLGGDSLPQRKPHPAPLLHAATMLSLAPEACCYVGDAERDIQAAKAANMYSIAALYGYLHPTINPMQWHADTYVYNVNELHATLTTLLLNF